MLLIELGVILGSLGVVLFTNIVYSAFLLGWVLICISFLYILLNADFVAAVQILIYVGTINVLIVFAVMLINKSQYFRFFKYWTVGDGTALALCITLFLSIIAAILNTPWSKISLIVLSNKIVEEELLTDNVQRIGFHLLTDSTLPFELLSIILLIALVGAITMARREETVEAEESEALKTKDDFPF
uniref:NAD(P)H-quinone oxidoreductase subunit 6, chloroplastic n=1 Tax=Phlegmariurus carinatus TaxID=380491 RepID=A0A7G7XPQ9_PHLCA|nr:NADH-plastoquinone oxidoreductase subunit 6 [Phlegmariurus carinatus]QNH82399.1 NADH-plastoquinone oxidoreductase subunit 6 [Phlegmariurus carinatus]WBV80325.1 NADH-plastoquinone oxidoreductase subunit 6 [Phlegmariurus squarrosus]